MPGRVHLPRRVVVSSRPRSTEDSAGAGEVGRRAWLPGLVGVDDDRSPVALDDRLGDCQSEAASGVSERAGGVGPHEPVEHGLVERGLSSPPGD